MRNPSTVGYEGAANLLEGFRVAADAAARGRGVMVVMNDEINAAREATKTDALRLQTFQTRGYGVLGVVDRDRLVFFRRVERRHTSDSEFDVGSITQLPRVDVILTYQGASGDLIQAAVDAGAQGVVLATAGAGATSGTQPDGVRYAASKGIPVVITTRTGSGRISDGDGGTSIAGQDLAPIKARILLMLALTRTRDAEELRRIFREYLTRVNSLLPTSNSQRPTFKFSSHLGIGHWGWELSWPQTAACPGASTSTSIPWGSTNRFRSSGRPVSTGNVP